MAVVIETTLGDLTVDLFVDQRPLTCLNFLKLCKLKYYNFNLFHTVQHGFIAQTGDPTGKGDGGQSVWGILEGSDKRYFEGEQMPKIKHTNPGLLSMVGVGNGMVGSQFFFTLASDLISLDGQHCVIGEVTEGLEILRLLNETICDSTHRPYQDIRITHTVVLEDPFNDPQGLHIPSRSPSPSAERLAGGRIAPDEELDETKGKTEEEVAEMIQAKEARARATILEIVGDLPDADMAPPENVLFVCKLNPVTSDDDLEIIFSRFGKINCCEVIRDKKTGDSLQYAFIEFDNKKSCEDAYFKMDNVLIDDRRIHVDFSQSVSKIKWRGKGRGVIHLDNNGKPIEGGNIKSFSNNNDKYDNSYNRNKYDSKKDSSYSRDNKTQSYREKTNDNNYQRDRYHSQRRSRERYSRNNDQRKERSPRSRYQENRNNRSTYDNQSRRYYRSRSRDRQSYNRNESRSRYGSESNRKYNRNYSPSRNNNDRYKSYDYKNTNSRREQSRSPNRTANNGNSSKDGKMPKTERKENANDLQKDVKSKKRKSDNPISDDEPPATKKNKASDKSEKEVVKHKKKKRSSLESSSSEDRGKKHKKRKKDALKKSKKKVRAKSTDSSSSSTGGSESSDDSSSSSSDSEPKKKSRKKKATIKKKYSSSSSSSSDSSSSSSSDNSTTSSSDSGHEVSRKKSKNKKSIREKKSKKKSHKK